MVRNFVCREGFQVEPQKIGLQQAIREDVGVMGTRGRKCQEAPGLAQLSGHGTSVCSLLVAHSLASLG